MEEETRQAIISSAQELAHIPREVAAMIADRTRELEVGEYYARAIERSTDGVTVIAILEEQHRYESVVLAAIRWWQTCSYSRRFLSRRSEGPSALLTCMESHPKSARVQSQALSLLKGAMSDGALTYSQFYARRRAPRGAHRSVMSIGIITDIFNVCASESCIQITVDAMEAHPNHAHYGFNYLERLVSLVRNRFTNNARHLYQSILSTQAIPIAARTIACSLTSFRASQSAQTFLTAFFIDKWSSDNWRFHFLLRGTRIHTLSENENDILELFDRSILEDTIATLEGASGDYSSLCTLIAELLGHVEGI